MAAFDNQSALRVAFKVKTKDEFLRYLKRARSSSNQSLRMAAAIVRKDAKFSIKDGGKRKRSRVTGERYKTRYKTKPRPSSRPGNPPKSWTGLLRKNIFYAIDESRQTAWIGPVKLNMKFRGVPEALEYGGKSQNRVFTDRGEKPKFRKFTMKARPFMGPALERVQTKLAKYWRGSLNR